MDIAGLDCRSTHRHGCADLPLRIGQCRTYPIVFRAEERLSQGFVSSLHCARKISREVDGYPDCHARDSTIVARYVNT